MVSEPCQRKTFLKIEAKSGCVREEKANGKREKKYTRRQSVDRTSSQRRETRHP